MVMQEAESGMNFILHITMSLKRSLKVKFMSKRFEYFKKLLQHYLLVCWFIYSKTKKDENPNKFFLKGSIKSVFLLNIRITNKPG